jgi:hypothetical protein
MASDAPADGRLLKISRALNVAATVALYIAGFGLVLMTGFVAWQVFARYVLNASPSWTEGASILVMSWFCLSRRRGRRARELPHGVRRAALRAAAGR